MKLWTFTEYLSFGGRGVISDWVKKDIEVPAKIEFRNTLTLLELTTRDLWVRPDYSPLDSEIGEIRFKANNLQHRVFGFLVLEEFKYIMLIGSTKKGSLYTPKDAIKTARERKDDVINKRSLTNEYTGHKLGIIK